MDTKIIAIAGGSASGKSSIVEYIKNYFSKGLFPVCKSDLSIWR